MFAISLARMTQWLYIVETLLSGMEELQTSKETVIGLGKQGNHLDSCFNSLFFEIKWFYMGIF